MIKQNVSAYFNIDDFLNVILFINSCLNLENKDSKFKFWIQARFLNILYYYIEKRTEKRETTSFHLWVKGPSFGFLIILIIQIQEVK